MKISFQNIKAENKSDTSCSSVHQGKEEGNFVWLSYAFKFHFILLDKITKPAKSNGAIQHLNSQVASQPAAPQSIFAAHPSSSHQRSAKGKCKYSSDVQGQEMLNFKYILYN